MKLQSEFLREFSKTIFARLPPLANAARCGPHSLATPLAAMLAKIKSPILNKNNAVAVTG